MDVTVVGTVAFIVCCIIIFAFNVKDKSVGMTFGQLAGKIIASFLIVIIVITSVVATISVSGAVIIGLFGIVKNLFMFFFA